jgi:hypothetical protein
MLSVRSTAASHLPGLLRFSLAMLGDTVYPVW